jgi:hypothetical protein
MSNKKGSFPNQQRHVPNQKSPFSNLKCRFPDKQWSIPNQHRRVANKENAVPSQENRRAGEIAPRPLDGRGIKGEGINRRPDEVKNEVFDTDFTN